MENYKNVSGVVFDENQITKLLRTGNLKHYQFYNTDFTPAEYAFHDFKLQNYNEAPYDIKLLNKSYYDIEIFIEPGVFPDWEKANRPINAIASYNNMTNIIDIYYLKEININENGILKNYIPKNNNRDYLQKKIEENYIKLCETDEKYLVPNLKIQVHSFLDELELLKKFFYDRIEEATLFLIGFNSNLFDNPYIFNRLFNLTSTKEEAFEIVSQFGELSNNGKYFKLPDYLLIDLLELYKPVDQGGGGFGKSLPNYKLQTIIQKELQMSKLDLPGGFNENYLNNLENYLLYNMLDVLPIFKLDTKLQFLELQWSLNSYNNSLMSATTGGRSLMYTVRNNLHYVKNNKLLRYTKLNKEIFWEN